MHLIKVLLHDNDMNKEDEILQNRIRDLADRSYKNSMYTFTDFLSMADVSAFYQIEREVNFVVYTMWGGVEDAERKVLRFGSEEQLGYIEEFPITILQVKPLMAKFSDDLTHRDILGALMNLGIERSVLGDIFLKGNVAYVFCLDTIAEYICDNLSKVKHTSVMCTVIDSVPELATNEKIDKTIQIQSERIDAIISKVYNLSRSQSIPLFPEKRIFVNGRQCENNSYLCKDGDVITVRGLGRFDYVGVGGISKKGKLNATVRMIAK